MDEKNGLKPNPTTEKPAGGFKPVGVTVFADLKNCGIVLSVNNIAAVRLSLKEARDLAMLLRQKANLVERSTR